MTEDQDDAGEVVAATVRVALTAVGQLAEQAARRREAALREAGRESAYRLATLQSQLAAERQLARHSVRDVLQIGSGASVDEVVRAWQQIRGWDDPVAIADRDRLRDVVRDRFGVDPDSLINDWETRSGPARAQDRDAPAVAAVLARDTAGQREDAPHRAFGDGDSALSGRSAGHLVDAGVDSDVLQARALAAQSHPTSPALAAQPPRAAPEARRRAGKRRAGVEMQSPGR